MPVPLEIERKFYGHPDETAIIVPKDGVDEDKYIDAVLEDCAKNDEAGVYDQRLRYMARMLIQFGDSGC